MIHNVLHREISGSTKHLQRLVLWSLRGLRQVTNANRDANATGKTHEWRSETILAMDPFKMWIPESILEPLIVYGDGHQEGSIPAPRLDIDAAIIQRAFLTPTIDARGLAAIIQVFSETSSASISIPAVVRALAQGISSTPEDPSGQLLRRYVEVCSYLPPSICHDVLAPLVNAFHALGNEASGKASGNDAPSKVLVSQNIFEFVEPCHST
jgi:hypothetical protein